MDTTLLERIGLTITSSAVVGAAVGGAISAMRREAVGHFRITVGTPSEGRRFAAAKDQVLRRLDDASALRLKTQSSANYARWSARLLTFAQYIIGGILASSFIQQKTSPQVIGIFGVLVLFASLITQHYHPEISAEESDQKASDLEALIREGEDRIVVIESTVVGTEDDPREMLELLEKISARMKSIMVKRVNVSSLRDH